MNIQLYASLFDIPNIKNLEYQTIYIAYSAHYEEEAQQAYDAIVSGNLNSNCGIQYRVELLPIPEQQEKVFGFTLRRFDFSSLGRYALLTYSFDPSLDYPYIRKAQKFIRTAEEYINWDRNEWIKECDKEDPLTEVCGVKDCIALPTEEKRSTKGEDNIQLRKDISNKGSISRPHLDFGCVINKKEFYEELGIKASKTDSQLQEVIEEKETLNELTDNFNRLLREKIASGTPLNAKLLQDIAKEMSVLVPEDKEIRIIVSEKYDVILTTTEKEEITLKFKGIIDKVLYLFFLIHNVSIPLRNLCDYKKELNKIYLHCKPGASDETRIKAINNLIDTTTGTINQVKSRINKTITQAVPSPSQNEQLKITGARNSDFSIKIDKNLVSIYGRFE